MVYVLKQPVVVSEHNFFQFISPHSTETKLFYAVFVQAIIYGANAIPSCFLVVRALIKASCSGVNVSALIK